MHGIDILLGESPDARGIIMFNTMFMLDNSG